MKGGGPQRCRLSSSPFLPEEITEQIIARVPCIKSLLRCTSVCKSWYAFINSASFINSHVFQLGDNNNNYKQHLLVCEFDEAEIPEIGYLYNDKIEAFQNHPYFVRHRDDADDDMGVVEEEEEKEALVFQAPYFAIHTDTEAFDEYYRLRFPLNLLQLHACNGLICYNTSDDPDTLYLWNPCIKILKQLPTPPPNLNNNGEQQHSVFKLWFDTKTNDHKILRITYTTKSCTVEVYSLTNNSWKIITDDAPVTTSFLNSNRLAYVNGTFYWPALRDDGNWTLISLQVDTWMFQERLTTWTATRFYLTPASGDNMDSQLFILGHGDKNDPISDVLALVGADFFQVYDHSNLDITDARGIVRNYQPLGIRNNGELLLQNIDKELNLISYSVETKQYMEFVPTTSHRLIRTIPFAQTLTLLNDADSYSTQ